MTTTAKRRFKLQGIAVPIGPRLQQLALAAALSYLTSRGIPSHPSELMNLDCIRLRYSRGAMVSWDFGKNGETLSDAPPPGRLVIGIDGAAAAIDLARSGKGIIATFENWLPPHFQRADLQAVLHEWWDTFGGPWHYFFQ